MIKMPAAYTIRPLAPDEATIEALADLLVETVAHGGSVSFMHPLDPGQARAFWRDALADAAAGGRTVFGAFDGERLAGTVSLLVALPPNQPHRGEIAKMMTDDHMRVVAKRERAFQLSTHRQNRNRHLPRKWNCFGCKAARAAHRRCDSINHPIYGIIAPHMNCAIMRETNISNFR